MDNCRRAHRRYSPAESSIREVRVACLFLLPPNGQARRKAKRVPPGSLFRRDRGRPRMLLDLLQLWLEAALQDAVDAVEIEVDDRRDVEREQLRHAQAADDCDAERLGQFGAPAPAAPARPRARK